MSETLHQIIFRHVYNAIGGHLPAAAITGDLWLATEDAANEIKPRKPDREAALEAEARALRLNFAQYLAPLYNQSGLEIANLCDEKLDRSGALLGYVRDAAIELRRSPAGTADQ